MRCPHCESKISLAKVRSEFRCLTCGGTLRSNVTLVEITALILVGVVTVLTPMERFSKLGEFIAYFAIAVGAVIIGRLFLRLAKV